MFASTAGLRTVALLGSVALTGCVSGRAMSQDAFAEDARSTITVEVANHNFADATLWLLRGGAERVRLGVVTGKMDREFTLPWPVSRQANIEIDLLAGSKCTTPTLFADPGDVLYLEIPVRFVSGACAQPYK